MKEQRRKMCKLTIRQIKTHGLTGDGKKQIKATTYPSKVDKTTDQ